MGKTCLPTHQKLPCNLVICASHEQASPSSENGATFMKTLPYFPLDELWFPKLDRTWMGLLMTATTGHKHLETFHRASGSPQTTLRWVFSLQGYQNDM